MQVDRRRAELARAMLGDIDRRAGDGPAYMRYSGGGANDRGYPARSGYYLGYRLAEHVGRDRTLTELATLSPESIRR